MISQRISFAILEYFDKKEIKYKKVGKMIKFFCPFCKHETETAMIIPNSGKNRCICCNKTFNIFDYVKEIENKKDSTDEQIHDYLANLLEVKNVSDAENKKKEELIDYYLAHNFALLALSPNSKIPIIKDWTNKEIRDKITIMNWLEEGCNLGLRTGDCSGITVIDVDTKEIDQELKALIPDTLMQETNKGVHYIFKYEPDLPKTRIDCLKVDIENNGGQIVISPSCIDGKERVLKNKDIIAKMPDKLKMFLQNKITVPVKTNSEKIAEDIETENFNLSLIPEGNRNSALTRLGGIISKELSLNQTEFVLSILNKHACANPLPSREISAMIGSISKYRHWDGSELENKVLEYLRMAKLANKAEIEISIFGDRQKGQKKQNLDRAMVHLLNENKVIRKGHEFQIVEQMAWDDRLLDIGQSTQQKWGKDFIFPYFEDYAYFSVGDLIILGSKTSFGKTHVAINFIKRLVDQGIKPYYVYNETGSRFTKIALALGLKEGDFYHTFIGNPEHLILAKDSITVYDWVCPNDFARTDKLYESFVSKLRTANGIMTCFVQLKEDTKEEANAWFAPNQIKQFASFAAKYVYEKTEGNGTDYGKYTKFIIEKNREGKVKNKELTIPCYYEWETKRVLTIEEKELEDKNKKEEIKDENTNTAS